MTPIVVKLGGSLLCLPDLASRIESFVEHLWSESARLLTEGRHDEPPILLVVGGGNIVEAIRELDKIHHFAPVDAHWACVQLLSQTAKLVHTLLEGSHWVATQSRMEEFLSSNRDRQVAVVDVAQFYTPERNWDLPCDWRTTTDSIAAKLASEINADLILLKSCPHPAGNNSWRELSALGYVDEAFPDLATNVKSIQTFNLRAWPSEKI